jgi:hypothetical protein
MAPSTGHRAPLPTPGKQPSSKPPTIIGVSHHTLRSPSLDAGADWTVFPHQEYEIICQSRSYSGSAASSCPQRRSSLLPPHQTPPVHGPPHRLQKRSRP